MIFDATKERLTRYGLKRRDAVRLTRALCAMADLEGSLKQALRERGRSDHDLHAVCDAIRLIIDGD